METLDDFKNQWVKKFEEKGSYDVAAMNKIVRSRVGKQTRTAMKYFWASFVFQMLVYTLLSHVIVKYFNDVYTVCLAFAGIAIFIPFTIVLMKRFKGMAIISIQGTGISSVQEYVVKQRDILQRFLTFKKRYELFLIPLSAALGVLLTYKLYVPGSVSENPNGALIVFVLTLASCYVAIRNENRKNFREPIEALEKILRDYDDASRPI